ncbi:MAG: hypothetical protein JWP22_3044, partial [Ramlibacter sp.]|nr:hypothetical protein [Ramlibacter sp.]
MRMRAVAMRVIVIVIVIVGMRNGVLLSVRVAMMVLVPVVP